MGDQEGSFTLGAFLTGTEAKELADHLAGGETLSQTLKAVSQARRARLRQMLIEAGLGTVNRDATVAVFRAIQGAHSHTTSVTPVWTTPGNLAGHGQLTASVHHLVSAARESVICSTFNFQRSSELWVALREAAGRPGVAVRVYVDSDAADLEPKSWTPTTRQVAADLVGAVVLRTRIGGDGARLRNHAKFIAIDHQFLLVTSANFSRSAERSNIELGVRIDDPIITQSVEAQMRALEPHVYEPVMS